ncbi:2-methylaconitate cis-trans isomerase PrpF family protein [Paracoccus sp. (in: a-proteobacteria)]|uniref:2-methylaconitate cis-trans isomerase PrpF family protein n=1 Tax=Paracoccus sp. TaxID=267 RepID=UPI002AFE3B80|nr:PrpF domain-containing protein [Paracoccus sp. (in: a-proteobacteria)]
MPLSQLPAVFMRGGTSNAIVFRQSDLPPTRAEWDPIFLAAMGSPDPNGRQLDGMGGGISSLSKVCVLGPPSRDDADVDYTFAQIPINGTDVDYSGNCGNMSSAMGPAAVEFGMIAAPKDGEAVVRIHNTNTGKVITARFPMKDGLPDADGDFAIDGVAGTAAAVRLEFNNPSGTKTGRLLPTGHPVDWLEGEDFGRIEASMIDAANPCVFVKAEDLGKSGTEFPADLDLDADFLTRMEAIRCAASVAMGIAPDLATAARIPSVPKVAIIAPPADYSSLSGRQMQAKDLSILVRMISIGQPHRAVPITGAVCLGIAARVPGSLAHSYCTAKTGPITVAHPSGTTVVDAVIEIAEDPAQTTARAGVVYRTARKLFSGAVWYRAGGA